MRSLQCRPNRNWRHVAILILAASNVLALGQSKKPVNFESDVLPIFQANCVPCHGSTVKMKGLDLSTLAGVMKGSDAGPVVTPGDPDESRLYKMVQTGAMPKGGKLDVEAALKPTRENTPSVVITVIDSGSGIDQEDLAKIFQPFFSAKKGKGIGLGLSISERIIKNHGGTIAVESMPGKGTTFRIHLPLAHKLADGVNMNNGRDPTDKSEDIDEMMKLFRPKA